MAAFRIASLGAADQNNAVAFAVVPPAALIPNRLPATLPTRAVNSETLHLSRTGVLSVIISTDRQIQLSQIAGALVSSGIHRTGDKWRGSRAGHQHNLPFMFIAHYWLRICALDAVQCEIVAFIRRAMRARCLGL